MTMAPARSFRLSARQVVAAWMTANSFTMRRAPIGLRSANVRDPGQFTNGTSGGDHFWRMLLSTAWGLEVVTKMGSDLYISIDVQHDGGGHRDPKVWSALWGRSVD